VSWVTNVLLSFDIMENEETRMNEVNAALLCIDPTRGQQLGDISGSEVYGGAKHMEIPLWGAAFNKLLVSDFMDAVRAAAWEYPENVRVFICDQDDDTFEIAGLNYEPKDDDLERAIGNSWNMSRSRELPLWWCLAAEIKQAWRDILLDGDPVAVPAELLALEQHAAAVSAHASGESAVVKP